MGEMKWDFSKSFEAGVHYDRQHFGSVDVELELNGFSDEPIVMTLSKDGLDWHGGRDEIELWMTECQARQLAESLLKRADFVAQKCTKPITRTD